MRIHRFIFIRSLSALLTMVTIVYSSFVFAQQHDGDVALVQALADPNASVAAIELSPYRGPRYFIGGHVGLISADENRLINGYDGEVATNLIFGGQLGIDYSPRLTLIGEFSRYTFTSDSGFSTYGITSFTGGAHINLVRSRGFVPYVKVLGGAASSTRDLSDQFSSSSTSITEGTDSSTILDIGFGLMYDKQKDWLADGDVRLLIDYTLRRDNNENATSVSYFQDAVVRISAQYMFGSSVFFGQKIVIEREVTSDDGGDQSFFREKREPVLYPSAAELAALSDSSQPNIIFFQQFSSYIVDTQASKIDGLVEQLEESPNSQVSITGHADKNDFIFDRIEQLRYNRAISAKRAVAVYNQLVSRGIDPERIQLQWRADQQPASRGEDRVSRSLNRRVQVQVR